MTELAKARMTEGVITTGRASRLPHTLYVLDEPTVGLDPLARHAEALVKNRTEYDRQGGEFLEPTGFLKA